jgi:hypothetical protein
VNAEILSRLQAKPNRYEPGKGSGDGISWQDIELALQGVDKKTDAFCRYVFNQSEDYRMDEPNRRVFWAGLFMEALERPEIQAFQLLNQGHVNRLTLFAVKEWRRGSHNYTDESRAHAYGVTRGVWNRRYRTTYRCIAAIPIYWLDAVERVLKVRLRE